MPSTTSPRLYSGTSWRLPWVSCGEKRCYGDALHYMSTMVSFANKSSNLIILNVIKLMKFTLKLFLGMHIWIGLLHYIRNVAKICIGTCEGTRLQFLFTSCFLESKLRWKSEGMHEKILNVIIVISYHDLSVWKSVNNKTMSKIKGIRD